MTGTEEEFENRRFAWLRSEFELVGLVGALAAWLIGVLLGLVWDPLFWLGAIAAVVILLATRRANRTPPPAASAILAPVDGVVASVAYASPPSELRLPASEHVRIRVASSPFSMNGVHAPIAGEVSSLVLEAGEPSAVIAMKADAHGLANAYMSFSSAETQLGIRLAAGGLGPRLDMQVEAGDPVRLGRRVALRRAGGWCDIYLPAELDLAVWPGMSLVAAETRLTEGADAGFVAVTPQPATAEPVTPVTPPEPEGPPYPTLAGEEAEAVATSTETAAPEPTERPETAERPETTEAGQDETGGTETSPTQASDYDPEDPAEMFKRLRDKVDEAADKDEKK